MVIREIRVKGVNGQTIDLCVSYHRGHIESLNFRLSEKSLSVGTILLLLMLQHHKIFFSIQKFITS